MDKIKSITHNNEWQLISQLCFFKKVLDSLWIVTVAFTTNSFNFFDLPCLASCFNVLEVNFWFLTEVYNGAKEVEKAFKALELKFRTSAFYQILV